MPRFTVTYLGQDELQAAYPLVRVAAPDVTLEAWREHASRLIGEGGGVLAASTGGGALQGIALYRHEYMLRHGKTLSVEAIVSFELSRAAPARAALCEALEVLALANGCDSIVVTLPARGYADAASDKALGWNANGMKLDSVVFARRLPRAAGRARPQTRYGCSAPRLDPVG